MKMEFDSEQIHRYLRLIKSLEWEVLAYRSVYEFVRDSERFSLYELGSRLTEAKAAIQPEVLAEDVFHAFRSGINLVPDRAVGTITWEAFLQRRYGHEHSGSHRSD